MLVRRCIARLATTGEEAHGRHRRGRHHHDTPYSREDRAHREHNRFAYGGRHGRRSVRPFDYGELRLLVLSMIEKEPRHGYELMRAIEEGMGGTYSPSPGVIYPTLSWLADMGYARGEADSGGKSNAI